MNQTIYKMTAVIGDRVENRRARGEAEREAISQDWINRGADSITSTPSGTVKHNRA